MNRGTSTFVYAVTSLLVGAAGTTVGQNYEIDWHTIDSGGVSGSSGNAYELSGTIGQHDAGTLAGGSYALTGGFWQAAATAGDIPAVST